MLQTLTLFLTFASLTGGLASRTFGSVTASNGPGGPSITATGGATGNSSTVIWASSGPNGSSVSVSSVSVSR